ncbi:Metallo-dependent phosphatase [Polychaeton citri CBS 116435]|uniref:Metallo-dependent phosphatase n=1 Tax=Polychaeton citri CBS 116435 TaxID=1314669 RepID=A0A9P4QGT7_9PEZI|nr:Metallo-dependent phosphatase [Polychaeton citri CBS 116435]
MAAQDNTPPGASITYTSGAVTTTSPPALRILHYNDVYHVEPGSRDPVGGISRFQTLCNHYASSPQYSGPNQPDLLTLFSGDAFNPSLESSVTKGRHMVPVLNAFNTSVSCLGNHDLDFGVEQFRYLAGLCEFPWLCANVLESSGEPLAGCKKSVVLTSSNGVKVGVVGLVEREWLDTLNSLPAGVEFVAPGPVAIEEAKALREKEGVEIVIALTHMRQPNDEKLAAELGKAGAGVDMVLGGHDHTYCHAVIEGVHVLKSGTDFKQLSYIEARRAAQGKWDFRIVKHDVVGSIEEHPETVKMVEKITSGLKGKLEKPIGYTAAPLDARFTTVRLKESNLGNFVCDLMRFHYAADCCIMAGGTIRGDQIYPPGVLKVKDIMNCFPFEDPCVVVRVKGSDIVGALENGVSKYPALEGRFPQVSNISFTFDPSKPEGKRILDTQVGGEPVELERKYTLATRDYMVRGKDGFDMLTLEEEGGEAESIVSEEEGLLISMILRQYFMSLKVLGRWKNWGDQLSKHWGGVHEDLHEMHPVREPLPATTGDGSGKAYVAAAAVTTPEAATPDKISTPSLVGKAQVSGHKHRAEPQGHAEDDAHLHASDSEDDHSDLPAVGTHITDRERKLVLMRKVMRKWWRLAGLKGHPNMCEEVGEAFGVQWTRGICPKLEGRITCVGS